MSSPERGVNEEVNRYMYESMTKAFADRRPNENLFDPQSPIARQAEGRIMSFRELGIDDQRIKVVSAIANIDLLKSLQDFRGLSPEDFGGC